MQIVKKNFSLCKKPVSRIEEKLSHVTCFVRISKSSDARTVRQAKIFLLCYGILPHIVVVTGETLPSRLTSLALGTGDLLSKTFGSKIS